MKDRKEYHRERQKEYRRKKRKELKNCGLCIYCHKPHLEKTLVCKNCNIKQMKRVKTEANENRRRNRDKQLKNEVYNRYGGYSCKCCGETREYFLSVDHIVPVGKKREGVGINLD